MSAQTNRNGQHHCQVIDPKSGDPVPLGEYIQKEDAVVGGFVCSCGTSAEDSMTVRRAKILIAEHQQAEMSLSIAGD